MRDHYLHILGLKKGASEDAIKKAFRKKALKFHPDRNDAADAEEQFIRICKAYEKLMIEEEEILPTPEHQHQADYYQKRYGRQLTPEEMEARLQKAKEHALYKKYTEDNIVDISYQRIKNSFIRKFSNMVAMVSISVGLIILFDYQVLPPHKEQAVILHQAQDGNTLRTSMYDVTSRDSTINKRFLFYTDMDRANFQRLPVNTLVNIYRTPLLHQRIAYSSLRTGFSKAMYNNRIVYLGYWFFQIVFFLPLLNFIARGPNPLYIVFLHLNSSVPIFAFILFIMGLLFL